MKPPSAEASEDAADSAHPVLPLQKSRGMSQNGIPLFTPQHVNTFAKKLKVCSIWAFL